ncbi:Acyl-CoA thioester hydrolase YbgC [Thermoflexales bacterium]|nr:Acyl-CoA thioester hydrolase YbgC [Thermoflexales bacterium]
MPLTNTTTFRVRYVECDAYGHVNNANYLRYMQEAAFNASAAVGYDVKRYDELGQYWLVRETEIEYFKPLRYDDQFEIKTWVADFRRVRSRRRYEFRLLGCNEIIAQGLTDWVYLDQATQRPVNVPPEMIRAFAPDGEAVITQTREAFPKPPAPPAEVFKMRRRVMWQDIDQAQHVNNAVYLSYVEDCGFQLLKHFKWPMQRMLDEGRAILIRKHRIQYVQPALFDDEIEVASYVYAVKHASAMRYYSITRVSDGALLVQVNSLGVWVDLKTGQPARFPDQFLADFAPNAAV